jgi:hypothetical protein
MEGSLIAADLVTPNPPPTKNKPHSSSHGHINPTQNRSKDESDISKNYYILKLIENRYEILINMAFMQKILDNQSQKSIFVN